MNRNRWITLLLLVLDVGCTVGIYNIIGAIRGLPPDGLLLGPVVSAVLATIIALHLVDGYKPRTDMISADYTSQHIIALLLAMVAVILLTYGVHADRADFVLQSSRLVNILSFITLIPMSLGYRRAIYFRNLARQEARSIVFLGDPVSSRTFLEEAERLHLGRRIVFCRTNAGSVAPFSGGDFKAEIRPFAEVLTQIESGSLAVEAIVLRETAREMEPQVSRSLVQLYFSGVPTYTLELFHEIYWQKIPIYRLNQTWLFQEGFPIAREPAFERVKRFSDIVLSLLGLVAGAPLVAASALAIRLDDGGPVFFAQNRVGKNHVRFRALKLRSMRNDQQGSLYTQPGDSRVTRVGRFLRAWRLDELPQLWNVLRGEMSLIGPRAEWDKLVATYENEIPCYHFRHLVKPGITGWAQVNYPYGANLEDTVRKLEYDLYYIRHFSFLLDARIVLKTVHVMLFGKGR